MDGSVPVDRTVGLRGEKVFEGFVRASDDAWLCIADSRSGERYVAIPTASVTSVESGRDGSPSRIVMDAAAQVYEVREQPRPATDIQPSHDDPDVTYRMINRFNQLALLERLKIAGSSLTIGDVDEETVDEIISILEQWKKRLMKGPVA